MAKSSAAAFAGDLATPESWEGDTIDVNSNEALPLLVTGSSASLTIQADHGNGAAYIYIGEQDIQDDTDNSVHALEAGQSISIPFNDTGTHWYVIGSADSLKVRYFFLRRPKWAP